MAALRERDTPDLVVMFFAILVGVVVVAGVIGGVIWRLVDPDADLVALVDRISDITNTLIGAVVGYLAGRGVLPSPMPKKKPDGVSGNEGP